MKKPSPIAGLRLLAERTAEDRERMLTLLEIDRSMCSEPRERIIAMLYRDFGKLSPQEQDRFGRILDRLAPVVRRRIGLLTEVH